MEKIKLTPEQLAQYKAIVDSIEKLRSLTEAEKEKRAKTMRTQGRKGCKIQRVNMAFSADNYDFLRTVSKLKGDSITNFVNFIVDKYREEHSDIYEQAKKLIEGL